MLVRCRASRTYCESCRVERTKDRNRRKNTKRRGARFLGKPYTLAEIAERDGWTCHLCSGSVVADPDDRFDGPSIDHIVPLARGAEDSPSNVALAHLRCNVRRGARELVA